jgi:aspartate aminotransferase-like enzyme/N-acyl-L-homoserine lactone synthetase
MYGIEFKRAETPNEIDEIHRLNHRIFAEEIGQHACRADGRLIDRFHDQNEYFMACRDGALVGMVSVHAGPEFSVAGKLRDGSVLGGLRAPLEVRLLAIMPEFRNGSLVAGLFSQVEVYARTHGYSDLLISGIVEREAMYRKLGFEAMGPAVTCGDAAFVPMRLSLDAPPADYIRRQRLYDARRRRLHPLSLLPGPVEIPAEVMEAFHGRPVSHRAKPFLEMYEEVRSRLSEMMGGLRCVILGGSGTLSNDVVAGNLKAAFGEGEGLVLVNGEFGERLVRHAERAGLRFRVVRFAWGKPWAWNAVEAALDLRPEWVWAVNLETSTGIVNDLARLIRRADARGITVAADCVSSLGAVDPHGAGTGRCFLASGVSGKALGSFAGLAFVFVSEQATEKLRGKNLCATFNLMEALACVGPVSTVSSPLVTAVYAALRRWYDGKRGRESRYRDYEALGRWVRGQMREVGLAPMAQEEDAAPTVTTFVLPDAVFARHCLREGFTIAHESDYLRTRGWGQFATMGELDEGLLAPLFESLRMERLKTETEQHLAAV